MRLNVYSQELILNYDRPLETVTQKAGTNIVYSGVRMFLHSSDKLHDDYPGGEDDDRSAITFWLPRSKANRVALAALFRKMSDMVLEAIPETGLD